MNIEPTLNICSQTDITQLWMLAHTGLSAEVHLTVRVAAAVETDETILEVFHHFQNM